MIGFGGRTSPLICRIDHNRIAKERQTIWRANNFLHCGVSPGAG
ncbi:hypothetical protein HMPREF1861_02292 [Corynebacterium kroppenstedtii]|nr:hypothetical protein HMPREF1861_02292 [Corynebacterium kroppenstedtii]